MELTVFARNLKIGLGRVIQYLKAHDPSPFRDAILHACLHNTTFDPQVEGYKTNYMMEIIDLMPDYDFYRKEILKATTNINEETDDRDAQHLVQLAEAFAQRGDTEARNTIYDLFTKHLKDEDPLGANAIVEIDSLDGFLFVADKLGAVKQRERK